MLRRLAAATSLALAAPVIVVVAANRAAAQGATACPEHETTVAVFNNGRRGSAISVYRSPSMSSALQGRPIRTGIDIKGRVVFRVPRDGGRLLQGLDAVARPNGSTGYIRKDQVVTYTTPFRIDIDLNPRSLKVYECGNEIMSTKIAIGKPKAPTPTGSFFLVDLLRPPKGPTGPYGPYAFGISGFSNVYQTYGGGDGRVGIHGTNAPSAARRRGLRRLHPHGQRVHHQAGQDDLPRVAGQHPSRLTPGRPSPAMDPLSGPA